MAVEAVKRLPFDLYARYRLAAEFVEFVEGASRARVLDVGGGPSVFQSFLPDHLVVASDLRMPSQWHTPADNLLLADGARLPFGDGSFDVVVTLDTLEHVEPPKRDRVVAELLRASSGWGLIACPCDTPGVAEADGAVLAYIRQHFDEEFETVQILTEHLAFGHPDANRIEAVVQDAGWEVIRIPSGRLDRWLPMMLCFFDLMRLGRDDPVERVQAWYNALFYRDDLRDPAYRQAFVVRHPEARGPALEEVAAVLLPSGPPLFPDPTALEILRTVVTEQMSDAVHIERERAAAAERELAEARRQLTAVHERLHQAEVDLSALESFRAQVLGHPAVRLRRLIRRLIGLRDDA